MDEIDKLLYEDEMELMVKHPKSKRCRRTTGKYKVKGKYISKDVY
jgi:hypothetical protein